MDNNLSEREVKEQVEKYKFVQGRYVQLAGVLEKVLRSIVKKYAHEAIVQVRAKAISSFAEKTQRKLTPKKDPVNEFTDLCGGRIIVTTPSEVAAICRFIESCFVIDWENSIDVSQRHKPSEFGYRSVHYIVNFRKGEFPTDDVPVEIPEELYPLKNCPMKAEIQVRTFAEHAWAVFAHDTTYKSAFKTPAPIERELNTVAALLEDADKSFERIQKGLAIYASHYLAYMDYEQMKAEIDTLKLVLEYDPDNADLAARIAVIANESQDWDTAIEVLKDFTGCKHQAVLRNLGYAKCRKHRADKCSEGFLSGQKDLMAALELDKTSSITITTLAKTYEGSDEEKAGLLYRQAYEIDPTDPYVLINYLHYEMLSKRNILFIPMMASVIRHAVQRCHAHIKVGINIPWSYFYLGKFHLLLEESDESMACYSRGISLTDKADAAHIETPVQRSIKALKAIFFVKEGITGFEWAKRFLLAGCFVKAFDNKEYLNELNGLKLGEIKGPVIILAGGCDREVEQTMEGYGTLLQQAFKSFQGTIISGGTTQGISGLAGDLGERYRGNIRTIGYLPDNIPNDATRDKRYAEIRTTGGSGFSPLQIAQSWVDIISSGIDPSTVLVLGINGGRLASLEYKMALALGAKVGLIEESGREASRLLNDEEWGTVPNLIRLPYDAYTIRAFLGYEKINIDKGIRERIAAELHEEHSQPKREKILAGKIESAPALAKWQDLRADFKESSLQCVDHIAEKLKEIGCEVYELGSEVTEKIEFTDEEKKLMASMEHGRWNAERLMSGWRYDAVRDDNKKTHHDIVPWTELPDSTKQYDYNFINSIPELLEKNGLAIRRCKGRTGD
jgi:ppGpp synthetase/RelA/SpoT-type nucleotidyltranferase